MMDFKILELDDKEVEEYLQSQQEFIPESNENLEVFK